MVVNKHALVEEARAFADAGIDRGYKPFDADDRIPGWKDRSVEHPFDGQQTVEYLAWVEAHGHTPSLKCYPEFQCQAIEGYAHGLISRLAEALALCMTGR